MPPLHKTSLVFLGRSCVPLSLGLKPLCVHLRRSPAGLPECRSLNSHTRAAAGILRSWISPVRCRMVDGPDCKVNMECVFVTCKEIPAKQSTVTFLLLFRYPITFPRDKCAGDLGDQPGVRSYGLRPADERYDVYCYTDGLKGKKHWL